jgi:uncharacterized membrane protein (DUF485 family)
MWWNIVFCVELGLIAIGITISTVFLYKLKHNKNLQLNEKPTNEKPDEESTDQPQKDNKEPESKRKYPNKIPAWFWILIASIGGAIVFIFIMILFQKWLGFQVNYENGATTIVLAFVGIAATFVVVSNYAQVKDIENKFEQKILKIDSELDKKTEELQKNNDEQIKQSLNNSFFIMALENFFYFMRSDNHDPNKSIMYLSNATKYMKDVRNKVFIEEFLHESYLLIDKYFNSIDDECIDIFIEGLQENSTVDKEIAKLIAYIKKKLDERNKETDK